MKIKPFELERYFARYEFSSPYLLSCSDCEAFSLNELLELADKKNRKLWDNLKLSYTESAGHPLLREEIARLYDSVLPEQVNVMVPEEAIFIAMNCILQKGDHVICTFPGYQSLYQIAETLGCEVSKWEPELNETWDFNVEDLKQLIERNTKLVIINFPHNPTGAVISHQHQLEIIYLCRQKNIILFSDEMYRFLEYDEEDRLPSATDLYENAVSLFGLSKSFALPGLRIGWLVSRNKKLMEEIACFKDYTTICNNAPGEILAIIALQNKDFIFKRNLQIISDNLVAADAFFGKYKNFFKWIRPKAGSIGFPEMKTNISVEEFAKDLVEKRGIMILPSNVYDFKGNFFRIGLGRKNMKEVMGIFEEYVVSEFL